MVFFPWENNTLGMFRGKSLQMKRVTAKPQDSAGETDLWESRGSWALSRDSGDPASQVGAGSSPGAWTATVNVNVTLAWLRTQGCPQDPRSTSQQLTAPHTGEHLRCEVLTLKCIKKEMCINLNNPWTSRPVSVQWYYQWNILIVSKGKVLIPQKNGPCDW